MSKYYITFSKEGYIKYTSHLDMVRLFERVFKRAGLKLAYSQGFNPHPKMVFAQPLSLGYTAEAELLEIETKDFIDTSTLMAELSKRMPAGIKIISVEQQPDTVMNVASRTVASLVTAAEFTIKIPVGNAELPDIAEMCEAFMQQPDIIVLKKQKKSSKMKEVDIKPLILEISGYEKLERNESTGWVDNNIILKTTLMQGSKGNLSPELLIPAFLECMDLNVDRSEIEVCRNKLILENI